MCEIGILHNLKGAPKCNSYIICVWDNIFKAQENITGKETIVKFDTLDISQGAPNKGSAYGLSFEYSQTCANDHLRITTTCQQWPP